MLEVGSWFFALKMECCDMCLDCDGRAAGVCGQKLMVAYKGACWSDSLKNYCWIAYMMCDDVWEKGHKV